MATRNISQRRLPMASIPGGVSVSRGMNDRFHGLTPAVRNKLNRPGARLASQSRSTGIGTGWLQTRSSGSVVVPSIKASPRNCGSPRGPGSSGLEVNPKLVMVVYEQRFVLVIALCLHRAEKYWTDDGGPNTRSRGGEWGVNWAPHPMPPAGGIVLPRAPRPGSRLRVSA
jgi:hypothetical protein